MIAVVTFLGIWMVQHNLTGGGPETNSMRDAIAAASVVTYLVIVGWATFLGFYSGDRQETLNPLANTVLPSFTVLTGVVVGGYFGADAIKQVTHIKAAQGQSQEVDTSADGRQLANGSIGLGDGGDSGDQPRVGGPLQGRRHAPDLLPLPPRSARRVLRGIDEQVAQAENAVAGKTPVKRNLFIKLTGATKSANRELEAKARVLAELKGDTTNLARATAEFVIDAYRQRSRIEKTSPRRPLSNQARL